MQRRYILRSGSTHQLDIDALGAATGAELAQDGAQRTRNDRRVRRIVGDETCAPPDPLSNGPSVQARESSPLSSSAVHL